MWRSITILGRFELVFLPFLVALAAFLGFFAFYRLLHRSARYHEFEVWDSVLLASLGGFILGRLTHIAFHFSSFALNWRQWLNLIDYPGVSVTVAIVSSGFLLIPLLHRRKITDLEITDFWARATCVFLSLYWLALFVDGSGLGYPVPRYLGLVFPAFSLPLVPAPLYASAFFALLAVTLGILENNYRTFSWYQGVRSSAKTGFLFCVFLVSYAFFDLFSLHWRPNIYYLAGYPLDWLLDTTTIIITIGFLYCHAFYHPHKKKLAKRKK